MGHGPFFGTWEEGLSTQMVGEDLCFWPSPNSVPKTGLNLSENLFFVWSSPNFGRKTELRLSEDLFFFFFFFWCSSDFRQENRTDSGWKNFHSDLCYSQIFSLPFPKSCATGFSHCYRLLISTTDFRLTTYGTGRSFL